MGADCRPRRRGIFRIKKEPLRRAALERDTD
jgi:hypothetical protein